MNKPTIAKIATIKNLTSSKMEHTAKDNEIINLINDSYQSLNFLTQIKLWYVQKMHIANLAIKQTQPYPNKNPRMHAFWASWYILNKKTTKCLKNQFTPLSTVKT